MLDKEIRFTPGAIIRNRWFFPVFTVAAFGVFWGALYMPWDSQGAVAWVQVVGSVAAVIVAILIANSQAHQRAVELRNKDEVVLALVVGIALRAAGVSSMLFHSYNDLIRRVDETNEEILTMVESQVLALRGINPVDLPHPAMVEPFLRIKAAMEQSYVIAGLLTKGRDGYIDQLRYATVFSHNSQAIHIAAQELARIELR